MLISPGTSDNGNSRVRPDDRAAHDSGAKIDGAAVLDAARFTFSIMFSKL
jgi:hypothetical protein